ncbi:MAG TPA: YdcF family protein [Terriglobales bacterium]|nr:YdcF family protein [Terriglobales bacterium]
MSSSPQSARHSRHWVVWLVAAAAGVAATFVGVTSARIVEQARRDEVRHADVIVVFGAAEYAGHPSPVYRARLDHAYDLFRQGIAPVVITTGGAGEDPQFSEGGVGHDYLVHRGIPESAVIAETQGANTAQSAERVATIMKANGMHNLVAVSDAYHEYRIKQLLEGQGVTVFAAPRPGSLPHSFHQRVLAVLREAVSYTLWKAHVT